MSKVELFTRREIAGALKDAAAAAKPGEELRVEIRVSRGSPSVARALRSIAKEIAP